MHIYTHTHYVSICIESLPSFFKHTYSQYSAASTFSLMGPQAETESQQFEFHAKSLKKLKVLNICISAALNTSPTN